MLTPTWAENQHDKECSETVGTTEWYQLLVWGMIIMRRALLIFTIMRMALVIYTIKEIRNKCPNRERGNKKQKR